MWKTKKSRDKYMNKAEFKMLIEKKGLLLSDEQMSQYDKYLHLLQEWNEKMNLTSIIEEEAVYEKHFYECLLSIDEIDFNKTDVRNNYLWFAFKVDGNIVSEGTVIFTKAKQAFLLNKDQISKGEIEEFEPFIKAKIKEAKNKAK